MFCFTSVFLNFYNSVSIFHIFYVLSHIFNGQIIFHLVDISQIIQLFKSSAPLNLIEFFKSYMFNVKMILSLPPPHYSYQQYNSVILYYFVV